jgi:hypothetical protein
MSSGQPTNNPIGKDDLLAFTGFQVSHWKQI